MAESTKSSSLRIGFFGGSFDPIHIGHISLAQHAIQLARLDTLLLCPAYHAPLRIEKPYFSTKTRLRILEKIAQENPGFEICKLEIEKQKTCYTYETIKEVQLQYPHSDILLLLGADQFNRLNEWKFHQELAELCQFLVFSRNVQEVTPPQIPQLSYQLVKNELIDCSSTEIRKRLQSGKCVDHLIPSAAYPFINQNPNHS
jgi:nicotinate-nucleotide adenylyltransferase